MGTLDFLKAEIKTVEKNTGLLTNLLVLFLSGELMKNTVVLLVEKVRSDIKVDKAVCVNVTLLLVNVIKVGIIVLEALLLKVTLKRVAVFLEVFFGWTVTNTKNVVLLFVTAVFTVVTKNYVII